LRYRSFEVLINLGKIDAIFENTPALKGLIVFETVQLRCDSDFLFYHQIICSYILYICFFKKENMHHKFY